MTAAATPAQELQPAVASASPTESVRARTDVSTTTEASRTAQPAATGIGRAWILRRPSGQSTKPSAWAAARTRGRQDEAQAEGARNTHRTATGGSIMRGHSLEGGRGSGPETRLLARTCGRASVARAGGISVRRRPAGQRHEGKIVEQDRRPPLDEIDADLEANGRGGADDDAAQPGQGAAGDFDGGAGASRASGVTGRRNASNSSTCRRSRHSRGCRGRRWRARPGPRRGAAPGRVVGVTGTRSREQRQVRSHHPAAVCGRGGRRYGK